MTINCIINDEPVSFENINANEPLNSVLRNKFALSDTKTRCGEGHCGSCTVLLDSFPVMSCILPMYAVQGCSITTIEYFRGTQEYEDIQYGFTKSGVRLCGFCDAAKYFNIDFFLKKNSHPTKEEIEAFIEKDTCSCVDKAILVHGILIAATYRRKRENESHG